MKYSNKFILFLALIAFQFNSCNSNPDPLPEVTPGMVLNDVSSAIGGMEMAWGMIMPVTPVQGICVALYGAAVGMAASGYFGRNTVDWPIRYSADIEKVNEYVRRFYGQGEESFSRIGQLHNEALFAFAQTGQVFNDDTITYNIVKAFLDTTRLINRSEASCGSNRLFSEQAKTIVHLGISSVDYGINSTNIEGKYIALITNHQEEREAIELIKRMSVTTWTFYNNHDIPGLELFLKEELGRINRNEYNLDIRNYTFAIGMANIFVHSYSYWTVGKNY